MKTIRFAALLLTLVSFVFAAHAAPPSGWMDDYGKAVEKAKAEKKNLLLNFTGSDWCGYCMVLDKEVFDTGKFKTWAKANAVLVQVDFPQGKRQSAKLKEQNAGLKSKYGTSGYPTIVIVDLEGKELARKSGYSPKSGADAYLEALNGQLGKSGASAN